ncbi:PREDICTED: alkylated DNA repair protein alkB homolog 8 isoform X2 [Nelumbo nucifera]|uniref:Alkylated DNA repair protein alkB homolog 8 isoform X2 n=1 Tax=Nelumbo nucifera TaxID=4432 RepID=A0A1U8Q440_NELNU|nr:PREDICTED: alkylated DNA repair protein alkB homolog 8 isoform X2 [Nelumbo nucifera]
MEDQKQILEEVFGESSDKEGEGEQQSGDSFDEEQSVNQSEKNPIWERIEEISGLWLYRDFLSLERQSSLLSAIEKEGWFTEASHNQAMRFGDLPAWAIELSESIRKAVWFCDISECGDSSTCDQDKEEVCPLPSDLLWREPLFDQLIVNVYQPGEGICGHVDLMRFEDGIAIVSLESACVMHFTRVKNETSNIGYDGKEDTLMVKIPVYLTPGSLVIMQGEARYLWKHEINRKPGFQIWEGQEICQKKRTSITLRKLCHANSRGTCLLLEY